MENIRDWNISRQLWWGHRIPVFTCGKCAHVWAAREDPSRCPKCGDGKITQDPDVLDTWFSSWLWPFATLGWPDETARLEAVLSRHHARDGTGDPVLLGRPHDHGGISLPGTQAVHDGVPARHRARHEAPPDVEVARQRHRSARRREAHRRRRAALDPDRRQLARCRRRARSQRPRDDVRARSQLCEQALEHRAVRSGTASRLDSATGSPSAAAQRAPAAPGHPVASSDALYAGRPLDSVTPARHDSRRDGGL